MGSINCKAFSSTKTVQDEEDAKSSCRNATVDQQPEADYVEKIVCEENDIGENEMKQFEIDDGSKVLVVKQNGVISAIGTKCSHYGALLSTGALSEGRIRCPWHGACFNIHTGDIEDFPGQDPIPCYKVSVDQGKVRVRAKRSDLQANKRVKDMVKRDPNNDTTFIVIGGGPSGGICVETLRQEGFTGRIILVCKENALPYDRVKLSKAMDVSIKKIEYRTQDFYDEYGIETYTGVEATKVNRDEKTVTLSNGFIIKYDKLLIATGSKARKPNIPGADLKNVVVVREFTDSEYIISQVSPEKHVVCLGLSFIGLESAAYLCKKVAKVTVIGRDTIPLRHSFGPEVGERIMRMFEAEGVEFKMQSGIKRCIDTDGVLSAIELTDGTEIKCDICIMGTGSTLCTEFLKDSGININDDGSIDTNVFLQTNVEDIYVAGDIANAPVFTINNNLATIGHYPLAQYHGNVAAKNMAGNETALKAVPYFWTTLFGKSFRYSGYGTPHETRIIGSLDDLKFVAIFLNKDGHVCGMASCQRDPIVSQFAELQSQGKSIHKIELDGPNDPFAWTKIIQPVKA
ncbi:apoptosis-inducing factor 3 isoform X2 [Contarinia nasturtii]|nr:apoptosis-inducing factor 3 isoform X2 [Contarinia nasturtii]